MFSQRVAQTASETLIQRIHRVIAETPREKVFTRWYKDKNQVESIGTFHGIWAASGEVRATDWPTCVT